MENNNIQEIKWENRFNTGYKRVDDQHKELVNILNKLNLLVMRYENLSQTKLKKENMLSGSIGSFDVYFLSI